MQKPPTPAEPAAAEVHTLIIRSDRALTISARTDDEARGRYWRELVTSRVIQQLTVADVRIVSALASLVNGEHFRASGGELVAWPGEDYLMREAGIGRAILWRSLSRLQRRHDLIERIEMTRGDRRWGAWRLKIPSLPAPTGVGARRPPARAPVGAPSLQARALAPTGARATPSNDTDRERARANNNPGLNLKDTTPAAPPPADNADAAAPRRGLFGSADDADGCADGGIVARLTAAGVAARQAHRLAREGATAADVGRVLAAAAQRDSIDDVPAWIVWMLDNPAAIPKDRRRSRRRGDGGSGCAATGEEEKRKARAAGLAETAAALATIKANAARVAGMPPAAAAAAIAAAAARLAPEPGAWRGKLERVKQSELAAGKWPSLAAAIAAAEPAELAPA